MSGGVVTLYHFTCGHGHRRIGRYNCLLIPQGPHPLLNGIRVIWLTELAEPDQETTGLGRVRTTCDRMAFRYVVTDLEACRRWLGSPERAAAPAESAESLESYGDPEHWWITDRPVPAEWDRSWRKKLPAGARAELSAAPAGYHGGGCP